MSLDRARLARLAALAPRAIGRLELRWRLSLVIGLLLTATLSMAALVSVSSSREAVLREVGANLGTATSSLDLTLSLLRGRDAADIETVLRRWSAGYAQGRHLCVSVESPAQPSYGCVIPAEIPGVPAWFARGAEAAEPAVVREVSIGRDVLRVHLVSDPRDELREAWSDARGLLLMIVLLAFTVNLCVFLAVSRGLRPLRGLLAAMGQIGRGDAASDLPHTGAPEMRKLTRGLRDLAQHLAQGREALRHLHLRNLELQEDERRMVARELHDEIGQHVAAIEMETIRVSRMSPQAEAERQARLRQLRSSVAEIHRVSRRIVHRLRPPAIESLGLCAALVTLFDRWRDEHPEPELEVDLIGDCAALSADRAVHLYRIVQESLSNVARHAGARALRVRVESDASQVRVQVMDDGCGFDVEKVRRGFGLAGMRERVEALGGTLCLRSGPGAGSIVEATVPLHPPTASLPIGSRADTAAA